MAANEGGLRTCQVEVDRRGRGRRFIAGLGRLDLRLDLLLRLGRALRPGHLRLLLACTRRRPACDLGDRQTCEKIAHTTPARVDREPAASPKLRMSVTCRCPSGRAPRPPASSSATILC